jgi:hypothetical protein
MVSRTALRTALLTRPGMCDLPRDNNREAETDLKDLHQKEHRNIYR